MPAHPLPSGRSGTLQTRLPFGHVGASLFAVATAALVYWDHANDNVGKLHLVRLTLEQPGWAIASFIALNAVVGLES